jgi:hypothetical protein
VSQLVPTADEIEVAALYAEIEELHRKIDAP